MRTIKMIAVAAVAILLSAPAYSSHYSDLYVIPVVAHTDGVNGTVWMSDVAIQNFQPTPLTVQLIFIESGEGRTENFFPLMNNDLNGSVTVPANGSVLLKDILRNYRGMSAAFGSLIVGADMPFAVTSRAYSMSPAGDTIGQTVRPSANFLNVTEGAISPASAYIPGLIQNGNFRTNLGLVVANATGFDSTLVVAVTLRDASGATVGTRQITVGPGVFTHLQFSARELTNTTFDIGSAEFRIIQGSGSVVPYASVIDNRTADAVFIAGSFPDADSTAMGKGTFMQSPFRSLMQQYRGR